MASVETPIEAWGGRLQELAERQPPPWAPRALLALAVVTGAALVLWFTRGQTFLGDEWGFFASYPGFDLELMFEPRNGHLVVAPVLLYNGLLSVVGPSSIAFRILLVALLAICAVLIFLFLRRRVGEWLALAGAALVLSFGSSAEVLASTLGITVLLAVALGLGVLLALERNDLPGNLTATVLLVLAIASYGPAFAFLAGAIVAVAFARQDNSWKHWWVFLAPIVLYGLWRLWAAPVDGADPTLGAALRLPSSLLNSVAAGLASVGGFVDAGAGPASRIDLAWGPVLLLAAIVAGAVLVLIRRSQGRPLDRWIWVMVAMPLAYWASIALVAGPARPPDAARYQLLSAIFLMLLFAQLGAGMRIRRPVLLTILALAAVGVTGNLANLRGSGALLRANSDENRAQLAAIELARDQVNPGMVIEGAGATEGLIPDMVIPVGDYLDAIDRYGSPAFSIDELKLRPQIARRAADAQLIRAYDIAPREAPRLPGSGPPPISLDATDVRVVRHGGCLRIAPRAPGARATLELQPGGLALRSEGSPPSLALSRFGDMPGADLPAPISGPPQAVVIPTDTDPTPWRLDLTPVGPVDVCSLREPPS